MNIPQQLLDKLTPEAAAILATLAMCSPQATGTEPKPETDDGYRFPAPGDFVVLKGEPKAGEGHCPFSVGDKLEAGTPGTYIAPCPEPVHSEDWYEKNTFPTVACRTPGSDMWWQVRLDLLKPWKEQSK